MTPPNFFLVGAPRTGTTALYRALDRHPEIFMSPIKEPCFFAPEVAFSSAQARAVREADAASLQAYLDGPMREKRPRGFVLEWERYLKLFAGATTEAAVGEASVAYLASPAAPAAIRARIARPRIVMMLRDPVDRLFSHWLGLRVAGRVHAAFGAWAAETARIEDARDTPSGMVWAGRYARHVRRYLESFQWTEMRAYLYDDFVAAPEDLLADLLAFLGVDPTCRLDVRTRRNTTVEPRWRGGHRVLAPVRRAFTAIVPPALASCARRWYFRSPSLGPTAVERAQVIDMYAKDIVDLEGLLGRDLAAWLDPEPRQRGR